MNAEILCVGTELLLGDIVNTNAAYIARGLAQCGVGCYRQTVVGDNPARLADALAAALGRADLVITTGGLGPTYDDLTKETVASYFGRKMILHERSLAELKALFKKMNRPMTPNNEKQAMMPEGAVVFANDRGTAPGLAVEDKGRGKTVILLPGPPREMTAMFELSVRPYLTARSGRALVSHSVHLFGVGESQVEDMLREYMEERVNPTVAPYAKEGEVLLRVTAAADTAAAAEALAAPVVGELRGMLAEYVYGVDVENLQTALVAALRARGLTVATAESCTGGLVSKRVTEVAGSSEVFGCGVTAYANEVKARLLGVPEETLAKHGAVSPETAIAMARGARKLSGADIGVSTTGIAGPDGGSAEKPVGLVYVAAASEWAEKTCELRLSRGYGGDREYIRYLASSHALYACLEILGKQ